MKTLGIAVIVLAASAAFGQATVSPDFSKAAIKVLAATNSGDLKAITDATVDASAAANGATEDAVVGQLKTFAVVHVMHIRTDAMNAYILEQAPNATVPDAGLTKDAACYTAWKSALRSLDATQPSACK